MPLLVAVVAFLPPVLVWFFTLRPYDLLLNMKRLTVFFVVGLGLGCISAFAQLMVMGPMGLNEFIITGIVGYVIGFSIVESLLKVIIFNFPSLANRYESSFEATVFGAAFGSGFPLVFFAGIVRNQGAIDTLEGATLFGLCLAGAILHASLGILVARGSQTADMWWWGMRAIMLQIPFNLMLFFWWHNAPMYYVLIGAIPYALMVWWKSQRVLKDSIPREAIKKAQREAKALYR
ncbi:MAG TPA: hypothetical protein ENN76_00250 [Euryarchaeota archaeon]|nr:hypothetical protein [Euryarchaeota archaeon]